MGLRDLAVASFGVKTPRLILAVSGATRAERIDFFPMCERSECESVVGDDDRHLDFRVSVLLTGLGRTGRDMSWSQRPWCGATTG